MTFPSLQPGLTSGIWFALVSDLFFKKKAQSVLHGKSFHPLKINRLVVRVFKDNEVSLEEYPSIQHKQ